MSDNESEDVEEPPADRRPEPSEVAVDGGVGRVRIDEIFEALSDRTRRYVLYYLRDNDIASVEEMARHVAAREAGISPGAVPADRREQVAARLLHNHLPRLEDARFIEYDRRSRTIRYTEPPMLLDTILGFLAQLERIPSA